MSKRYGSGGLLRQPSVTDGWKRWAVLWLVWGWVLAGGVPALAESAPGTELLLNTVDGKSLRLADLRGKVVLVNFWATWCPPCLEEIPELIRFHARYADKGVVVIGVDYMDHVNLEQLKKFIAEHQISYPIVYGEPGRLDPLAKALGGVFGLPITKLLDRQGRVVSSHMGGVTEKGMRSWVEPLLTTSAAEK
ncbi:MAG: TlpA family protein disulfide reductase [Magnetococcus sp. MYC-9]